MVFGEMVEVADKSAVTSSLSENTVGRQLKLSKRISNKKEADHVDYRFR